MILTIGNIFLAKLWIYLYFLYQDTRIRTIYGVIALDEYRASQNNLCKLFYSGNKYYKCISNHIIYIFFCGNKNIIMMYCGACVKAEIC